MAETHKEIVKVWIAPGCIVCDACETDCPEVFDVQEETCVIRPPAKSPEFTKGLTPSIIVAAEGCPVDVIKFETIDVEGPEPAAWKQAAEPAARLQAAAVGGAAKKAGGGTVIPDGPPSPKWAGLLQTSTARGGFAGIKAEEAAGDNGKKNGHGGATAVEDRLPAKAPAEAIAAALGAWSPPDAYDAAMVGSGYSRPRPGMAERIRLKAEGLSDNLNVTRREFNYLLALAWGLLAFTGATVLGALQSFMVVKETKEPPATFRAGKISDYATVGVYEQFKGTNGVWIVHLPDNRLVAISDICTHLGCIPNWLPADAKFKCPCHGSGYYMNGVNFEGPAPRPLERFKISLDGEFVMVDKSEKFRSELGQWDAASAFIAT